jgi:methionyl aminopeptidase
MKLSSNKNKFLNNSLIHLYDQQSLTKQKFARRCVSSILKECGKLIKANTPNLSLKDLEQITYLYTKNMGCTPTFLNYKGFPGAACISVNKQLVHGIPTDYILQDGDVVSVDVGATYEGKIADAARTWIYGTPKSNEHVRLLFTCKNALKSAIKNIDIGKHLGIIGYTIYNETKNKNFGLITSYGGHHISDIPHAETFIANKSGQFDGHRMQAGEVMAIEPMLVLGQNIQTKTLNDGWTVITEDIGCHFEDTVVLMEDGKHIITEIPNED